jgi:hypothetical protein
MIICKFTSFVELAYDLLMHKHTRVEDFALFLIGQNWRQSY